ncbi:hypothetical protein [Halpernia frigidisoli]|uniref:hypothetical protein n=1 Tax=Halpernia frigidisoli TaxID=1125876 RepID=UPI001160559C|nr:hypothetical protein [Halpernia frigidisoli]
MKIWSGIFFIAAFGMKLFGMFLKDISYDFQTFNIQKYLLPTFMLLIGVLIFVLTDKTVEKVK